MCIELVTAQVNTFFIELENKELETCVVVY